MNLSSVRTKKDREHIAAYGEEKFWEVLGKAMFVIKSDARLTGLDLIRNAIGLEAALRATGRPPFPLKIPYDAGEPNQAIVDICEEILVRAAEAARPHEF